MLRKLALDLAVFAAIAAAASNSRAGEIRFPNYRIQDFCNDKARKFPAGEQKRLWSYVCLELENKAREEIQDLWPDVKRDSQETCVRQVSEESRREHNSEHGSYIALTQCLLASRTKLRLGDGQ